ncbi:MAG: DUF1028 domain-containing protein [Candidatus Eiseniibacteriota bacterium]
MRPLRHLVVALAPAFALAILLSPVDLRAAEMNGTVSVVGMDPLTGEMGVAVLSHTPACGNEVPWVQAGVGAVATLGESNADWGPRILGLLREGLSAAQAVDSMTKLDPHLQRRQVGVIDRNGKPGGYTGLECLYWSGGVIDNHVAAQGNFLKGHESLQAIYDSFKSSVGSSTPLAERLLSALRAGEAQGGDRRGARSGALLVGRPSSDRLDYLSRFIYLRVDDASDPLAELDRLYRAYAATRLLEAHLHYADSYRKGGAAAAERLKKEEERANAIVEQTLGDKEATAPMLNAVAWQLAQRGMMLDRAQTAADRALKLQPENPEILDTIAEVRLRQGRTADALTVAKQAAALEPRDEYLAARVKAIEKAAAGAPRAPAPKSASGSKGGKSGSAGK